MLFTFFPRNSELRELYERNWSSEEIVRLAQIGEAAGSVGSAAGPARARQLLPVAPRTFCTDHPPPIHRKRASPRPAKISLSFRTFPVPRYPTELFIIIIIVILS